MVVLYSGCVVFGLVWCGLVLRVFCFVVWWWVLLYDWCVAVVLFACRCGCFGCDGAYVGLCGVGGCVGWLIVCSGLIIVLFSVCAVGLVCVFSCLFLIGVRCFVGV